MRSKKIYIRVDGGNQIGLGHLVRCFALAKMIQSDFVIIFVCQVLPDSFIHEIKESKFLYIALNDEPDFFTLINPEDIILLDGYHFNTHYQRHIKQIGCKLICIDDIHENEFYADLIINHAPNVSIKEYSAQPYTKFALGLDYVLLRPTFLEKAKITREPEVIKTVFVCFGGSDNKNITKYVAEILKKDARFSKIILVTGASYVFGEQLLVLAENDPRIKIYNAINSDLMCGLIESAQLAIVPASGILQEVLAVGVKVISGMYVENQSNIFNNYKKLNAFESAGRFT